MYPEATMSRPSYRTLAVRLCALLAILYLAAFTARAHASLTLLVGDPFGNFGTAVPNGHASIYLDRVCADGPLTLRMCHAGEPPGVVIARYRHFGTADWVASPVMEFLFAASRPGEILLSATPETLAARRELHRKAFMPSLLPDGTEKLPAYSDWWETAGMAFDRSFFGYRVATSAEQDAQFVAALNGQPNISHYSTLHRNCANFAAQVIDMYFPGTVRDDRVADFAVMSPKQVARRLTAYADTHPEARLRVFRLAQLPGTLRRSRPIRGGAEGFLKTKRYAVGLTLVQPEFILYSLIVYLGEGRWQIGRDATPQTAEYFEHPSDSVAAAN
jgi:hypothetical protein